MEDIDRLIEDYELASARLTHIIADVELQEDGLQAASEELDRSFGALMGAQFDNQQSIVTQIEYLLKIIKIMHPDDSVLASLADRIHSNVRRLQLAGEKKAD